MEEELLPDIQIYLDAPEGASAEERKSYLDEACAGDPELRSRVEALFKAEKSGGNHLAEAPFERAAAAADPGNIHGAEEAGSWKAWWAERFTTPTCHHPGGGFAQTSSALEEDTTR